MSFYGSRGFFTERRLYVTFKNKCSPVLIINTGAPQGCILSALLFMFTLYTYDCQSLNDKSIVIKYANDTVIIALMIDDVYFDELVNFHK